MDGHGRLETHRAHRAQPCGSVSSGWVLPSCTRSELIRGPRAPSRAGRSVVAAVTATSTAIPAVYPRLATIGIPAKAREQRAMITVPPAKTTAPPAVATSALLTYALFSRRNEIVALRAGGISLGQTAVPVLAIAAALSVAALAWNETVVPYASRRFQYVNNVEIRERALRGVARLRRHSSFTASTRQRHRAKQP